MEHGGGDGLSKIKKFDITVIEPSERNVRPVLEPTGVICGGVFHMDIITVSYAQRFVAASPLMTEH